MEQLCELCDNAGPLTVRGRCHPTAPLRIEIDNGFLNAFCYVPSCNRLVATLELAAGTESESAVFNAKLTAANAEIERLKADIRDLYTERQHLRDILLVPLPAGEGTAAAEFGACYPLVESAQRLRAERDELLAANAKLDSYLEHTADGALVCETEEFYCPNCGSEVKQNCGICYCWECANPDDGGSPNMPPLPMSYESTYADPKKRKAAK